MEEVFLKIGEHSFYRVRTGEALSINTERNSIKKLLSLPSGYMKDVAVISKEQFDKVLNQVKEGV